MQVSESSSTGLKRELKVVIGQGELTQRFTTRLDEVRDTVQLKGFRKGKVPVAHIKKLYGRSVMAEVLQQTVEETSRKALEERKERAAHQPNIALTEDKEELERVLTGQGDLAFTISYEALPDIALTDLTALKLERPMADVNRRGHRQGRGEPGRAGHPLRGGGGSRRRRRRPAHHRLLGPRGRGGVRGRQGRGRAAGGGRIAFIPGFVEGLIGAKAGEERAVNVKFPDDYPEPKLAGKDAVFAVKVKEVAKADQARAQRRVRQDAGGRDRLPSCVSWLRPGSPASTRRSRA